jgi:hypothetical protein
MNAAQHREYKEREWMSYPLTLFGMCAFALRLLHQQVLGAGLEPAFGYPERDFKSLASTHFAIRAIWTLLRPRHASTVRNPIVRVMSVARR